MLSNGRFALAPWFSTLSLCSLCSVACVSNAPPGSVAAQPVMADDGDPSAATPPAAHDDLPSSPAGLPSVKPSPSVDVPSDVPVTPVAPLAPDTCRIVETHGAIEQVQTMDLVPLKYYEVQWNGAALATLTAPEAASAADGLAGKTLALPDGLSLTLSDGTKLDARCTLDEVRPPPGAACRIRETPFDVPGFQGFRRYEVFVDGASVRTYRHDNSAHGDLGLVQVNRQTIALSDGTELFLSTDVLARQFGTEQCALEVMPPPPCAVVQDAARFLVYVEGTVEKTFTGGADAVPSSLALEDGSTLTLKDGARVGSASCPLIIRQ